MRTYYYYYYCCKAPRLLLYRFIYYYGCIEPAARSLSSRNCEIVCVYKMIYILLRIIYTYFDLITVFKLQRSFEINNQFERSGK